MKNILDVCCSARSFWYDKNNPDVTYMDIRELDTTTCDGRRWKIDPDVIGDYTNMPFADGTFKVVVFDPPHLIHAGDNSWLAQKYGKLPHDWSDELRKGFAECMRVLEPLDCWCLSGRRLISGRARL
jgi:hypothetical protein